jgi:hypothetical protein
MSITTKLNWVTSVLSNFREIRDTIPDQKLKQLYSDVCERLDVLESNLIILKQGEKPLEAGTGDITDADLNYAATDRCVCGAGMAYFKEAEIRDNKPGHNSWVCSRILKDKLDKLTREIDPFYGKHLLLPFAFYAIKDERQPSAQGVTTRPV